MNASDDQIVRNLHAGLREGNRLRALPAEELIAETLGNDAADDPRVIELMDRVLPGWESNSRVRELVGDKD